MASVYYNDSVVLIGEGHALAHRGFVYGQDGPEGLPGTIMMDEMSDLIDCYDVPDSYQEHFRTTLAALANVPPAGSRS